MFKITSTALALIFSGLAGSQAKAAEAQTLQQLLTEATPALTHKALDAIPDVGRKLLAARSYMRSQASLEARWSWDEVQIAAFEGSAEQKALLAEIKQVAEHFSATNPGFSLYANTQVRSLDKQITAWNGNASVGAAASSLLSAYNIEFSDTAVSPQQLKNWLVAHKPQTTASLAAPGLSAHGQMHAIDFQVQKDGIFIAPADTTKVESVWLAEGWGKKLQASIMAAGADFHGPLQSPDEPWHYNYMPNSETTTHSDGQ
jgi:hypothetical protein